MRFQKQMTAEAIVRDPGLGHAAARLGAVLALMADSKGSNAGWAWPHQSTLAGWMGVSVSSVERAVRELERAGWIEVRRTRMGNSYRVLQPVDETAWLSTVLQAPETRHSLS